MDFDKRLERAIQRGERSREARGKELSEKAVSEGELRDLHSQCRLDLSEHIDTCLRQLSDHFLGFQFETLVGEGGWGWKISRDDVNMAPRRQSPNLYSRLELLIRPFSSTRIVELTAKGTIRNKEIFNRAHYQFLSEVDVDSFRELIDLWVLEYAEQYSARN